MTQVTESKRLKEMCVFQSTRSEKLIRSNDFLTTPNSTSIEATQACVPHRCLEQIATARTT
mgnify:FL=1